MSIVTKGLGGRSLITKGYGIWEWIVEKVVEIVRAVKRIIPIRRKIFKFKIIVKGDTSLPMKETTPVLGSPVFVQSQTLPAIGEPIHKTRISSKILGTPSIPIDKTAKVVGETSHSLSSQIPISGDLSIEMKKEILCKGKRDQRDLIWAILDNDEEEG